MTNKEIEFIQKLNSNSIIKLHKKISEDLPLKEMLEIYNNHYKQIKTAREIIQSSQVIQINKILTPELLKLLEERKKLISNLENNPIFKEIWNIHQENFSFENQENFEVEIKKFRDDINEFAAQIPENILEENFPAEEVLEEFNKINKTSITKETLISAIIVLLVSTQSNNIDISQKAIYTIEAVGKFSKTDLGSGIGFLMAVISFLFALKEYIAKK